MQDAFMIICTLFFLKVDLSRKVLGGELLSIVINKLPHLILVGITVLYGT